MSYLTPEIGEQLSVQITNKNAQYGIFVSTPNGISGLVRKASISWSHQNKFFDILRVGDYIQVLVKNVHLDGKLELSRKEAYKNPRKLLSGMILKGIVDTVESYGLLIRFDAFIGLAPWKELSSTHYKSGDDIICVVKNVRVDETGLTKVTLSTYPLHSIFAQTHNIGERISAKYIDQKAGAQIPTAIISVEDLFLIEVTERYFIEPYKTKLISDSLVPGQMLEFVYSKYNEKHSSVWLDMRPIEKENERIKMEEIRNSLHHGDIIMGEVKYVDDKIAKVEIIDSGLVVIISRDELSPNKVLRASDEVFVGEHIKIVYTGIDEQNKVQFSRRYIIKDRYEEKLYTLPLMELLETMDIQTNCFIGKVISINGTYFFTEMMTYSESDSEVSGKLLIDPTNGKNILVRSDNRLRNLLIEGKYYKVEISLPSSEFRHKEGTPYIFSVSSPTLQEVPNPYKEAVDLSFKQHTSPNTNTSVANLLDEVGQNLYTSKKRMFFELLQNADDAAGQNGVKVKIQLDGKHFLLTHDGYSFNRHDFESITSAAKSTKAASRKKTGYKGIGFKSVFTNSESVYIQSSGFRFSFNKSLDIYNDFDRFYFLVNDIEHDQEKQANFIHKYEKFKREFKGVKDIPWQLLPIWSDTIDFDKNHTIWSDRENVCIALQMDERTLSEYAQAIEEVFSEPRFMLFLRRTNRIQLIQDGNCRTIQKNISDNGEYISLVNSFDKNKRSENYKIYTKTGIEVSDKAFEYSGVLVKRKERKNNRGEIENYFIRLDANGIEQSEVPGIPDRIASTNDTSFSFAIPLDADGHIKPIDNNVLSLYAYLPMNEHRFRFPFFINADFIPKSDREGVQSDNPWNHFLFYNIGKTIVSMVEWTASIDEPNYLNLLPQKEFESTGQDTYALIESFNKGYTAALSQSKFIINDKEELVGTNDIILDKSSLAETLGHENFYKITSTAKRLPHKNLNVGILEKSIFKIERTSSADIAKILQSKPDQILSWITSATEKERNNFYMWLTENEDTIGLIPNIPSILFGNQWVSYHSAINTSGTVIITEKTLGIKDILIQLGYLCSDTVLEQHPLKDYLQKQDEKVLFSSITSSNTAALTYTSRLRLFNATKQFEGIGDDTLKKWSLFKNAQGEYTPLCKMCPFSNSLPNWLKDYMIANDEYNSCLNSYLISSESIYSSIVENNIDQILSHVDVYTVYQSFRQNWRHSFTQTLINKRVAGILPIVEQEDSATKEQFIKAYGSFDLNSTSVYTAESEHYRLIKIAAESPVSSKHLRSIIKVDGIPLSDITLKDEFGIVLNDIRYSFSLSSVLPAHIDSSKLATITDKFSSIVGYENVFSQTEASASWVKSELMSYISKQYGTPHFTAIQYCFMMLYYKSLGHSSLDTNTRRYVDTSDTTVFKDILNKCLDMKVGDTLRTFINDQYINYSFGRLSGRYIDCEDYTLPEERIQGFVSEWANTVEKKSFLTMLGVHNETSDEIQRRKSFKDNRLDDIWGISSPTTINTFLSWVKTTESLPINTDNKVCILKNLFAKINIHLDHQESDFSSAQEWSDDKYITWKATHTTRIYLIDGEMPYRGVYSGVVLFNGKENNSIVFNDSKHIYINKNIEPEVVLADVYSHSSLFTKDDWREIFLVSRATVNDLLSEVERLRNEKNLLEEQIAYSLENNEEATMQKGEDPSLSKREMIEAQLEAQQALMRAYPDWGYPNGFGETDDDGNPYCYSCNVITTENGSEPIVLKSFKYQGGKFMVNPTEYLSLIRDKAQLLIYDGLDFKRISVIDLLRDQTKVSITFSSKNLESDDKVNKLAEALNYFNSITFNFDSFNISSRAESIRHIYVRHEGTQAQTTDDDL